MGRRCSARRTKVLGGPNGLLELFCVLIVALGLSGLFASPAFAQQSKAQQSGDAVRVDRNFDHSQTGFALDGRHATARCESCHNNAIFKGLPTTCVGCHSGLRTNGPKTTGRPANHIPSSNECADCHTTVGLEAGSRRS